MMMDDDQSYVTFVKMIKLDIEFLFVFLSADLFSGQYFRLTIDFV